MDIFKSAQPEGTAEGCCRARDGVLPMLLPLDLAISFDVLPTRFTSYHTLPSRKYILSFARQVVIHIRRNLYIEGTSPHKSTKSIN
jgi:hypothetical protein